MKYFLYYFSIIIPFCCYSQRDASSLYFGTYTIDSTQTESKFDKKICGTYLLDENGYNQLVVSGDSMYSKSGTPIIIPLSEAIKKGFVINENKIQGIDPKRSLHCKIVNDTVFTIYYQEDCFFSPNRGDVLTKFDAGFLLNIKENNGFYSYYYIEKNNAGITVKSIDHENQMHLIYSFPSLYSQYIEGVKTYIIKPTYSEMIHFFKQKGFNEIKTYKSLKS